MQADTPATEPLVETIMRIGDSISAAAQGLLRDGPATLTLSACNLAGYKALGHLGRHRDNEPHRSDYIASVSPIGRARFNIERRHEANIVVDLGPGDVLIFNRLDHHWAEQPYLVGGRPGPYARINMTFRDWWFTPGSGQPDHLTRRFEAFRPFQAVSQSGYKRGGDLNPHHDADAPSPSPHHKRRR
jgi:hypothetical protein